ncbi:MAG: SDR family NAD(P)-dependent oxidoreductase [Pseudomonadota bacterium]
MTLREWSGKTYWLVGASDGLGAALAEVMSRSGAELVLSARSSEKLAEMVARLPGAARSVPMDIADDASVAAAAQEVGAVDGIVLLAGVYWPFSARDWNAEAATAMADVNFTGFIRVLGQVVPDMVARDDGHIVITSSLTAFRGLPGSIGYTASKAGTLSLAESMYCDLRKTGVEVQVCNPGFIRTRMTDKNDFDMPAIMEPEAAAREMFEHMNSGAFKKSFPYGFSLVFRLGQFLPDWLYYRIFS